MYCPKCKSSELKQATVKDSSGVTIDYCQECKGFWLDKEEFETLCPSAVKKLSLPLEVETGVWPCPRCRELIYSFDYPQTLVTVEMCKFCKGFWIDASELKEIETVRKTLKQQNRLKKYDAVGGIKGEMINFIDKAIKFLQSC